jgi:hypothetical protein
MGLVPPISSSLGSTSQSHISKPKSETTTIEAENTNIEISQTGPKINTM